MALSASTRCVCSINGVCSKDGKRGDVQSAGALNTLPKGERNGAKKEFTRSVLISISNTDISSEPSHFERLLPPLVQRVLVHLGHPRDVRKTAHVPRREEPMVQQLDVLERQQWWHIVVPLV